MEHGRPVTMTRSRRAGATRGFLFADLRGYTAFLERRGANSAAALLERYRHLVRGAVADFEGAEIRTEGDSFYVVFPDASAAVGCGLAIAEAADEATAENPDRPVRVGIGVHAGEAVETSEGFVGAAVNLAARLCAAAAAGEVLVSDTVRALTAGVAPVQYLQRGRLRFKGISEPVTVYRVVREGTAPSRRLLGPRVMVGGVLLMSAVIVTVVLVGGALAREGSARSPAGSPQSSEALSASPRPSWSSSPTSSAGAFPTTAEAGLMELVDERYEASCTRAPANSTPLITEVVPRELGGGTTQRPVAFSAGIVCSPFLADTPDQLAYWRVSDWWVAGPDELITNRAAVIGASAATCGDEQSAFHTWSAGPTSGRLLCHATTSVATLYWTYDGTDVLGKAVRDDGDMAALMAWWNDEARYQSP
jgi:class 3 adenylate cyclase